ncbi:hypothetical protein K505DRAFT_249291, partial [Melanomma pulvis-pyrius CBS 109.77]
LSVGGTAVVLGWMLIVWKIYDRPDCWYWFCQLMWFTGGTVCLNWQTSTHGDCWRCKAG